MQPVRALIALCLVACGDKAADTSGDTPDPLVDPIADAAAELRSEIGSLVTVTWTQAEAADASWVEYSFDAGEWLQTPEVEGATGEREALLLGIPFDHEVTWRVVTSKGDQEVASDEQTILAGPLPEGLPALTLDSSDPALWEEGDRWLLTSTTEQDPWVSVDVGFWLVIIDRQGRYVWAQRTADQGWTLFAKPARDGGALLYDETYFWTQLGSGEDISRVHRITLDGEAERSWRTDGLHHSFDDLSEDTIVWSGVGQGDDYLKISAGEADAVTIWACAAWIKEIGMRNGDTCGANGLAWYAPRDSFILSIFSHEAVVEVTREGEVAWYSAPERGGGYAVPEADAVWQWQHEAELIADDRLLLSSGWGGDGSRETFEGTAAYEYIIDFDREELTLAWAYRSEGDWVSHEKGGAKRLPGGNTLHYYGNFGGVREVTPDGEVAWQLRLGEGWVGRSNFLGDLYDYAPSP